MRRGRQNTKIFADMAADPADSDRGHDHRLQRIICTDFLERLRRSPQRSYDMPDHGRGYYIFAAQLFLIRAAAALSGS